MSKTTPKQTKNTTAATLQGSVAHRQSIYIQDLGPGFSSYPVLPKWKGGREAEEERDGGSMSSSHSQPPVGSLSPFQTLLFVCNTHRLSRDMEVLTDLRDI